MKSIRLKLMLYMIVLGIILSLGTGITMYFLYAGSLDENIASNLRNGTRDLLTIYDFDDFERWEQMAYDYAGEYEELLLEWQELNEIHNYAYIYLMIPNGDGTYYFILDSDNVDTELEDSNIGETYDDAPPEVHGAYQQNSILLAEPYTDEWGTFLSAYAPISDGRGNKGVIGVDFDISYVNEVKGRALSALGFTLLFAVLLAGALGLLIALQLSREILAISRMASALADGDLTNPIQVRSRDEIGRLAESLDDIRLKFAANIRSIQERLKLIHGKTGELDTNMKSAGTSLDVVDKDMQELSAAGDVQNQSSEETAASVEQILRNIESLNSSVENQSTNVAETSSSVEEMVGNIQSIAASIGTVGRDFESLLADSRDGQEKMDEMGVRIREVATQSSSLIETIAVITGISEQTNLLAMNAAIEAAHAGEAGRGFAVVADEIRKLAELTGQQATQVHDTLNGVKDNIESVVPLTSDVGTVISSVSEKVGELDALVREVEQAVAEQSVGSKEIIEAVARMNDVTSMVSEGAGEMKKGSDSIMGEVARLRQVNATIHDLLDDLTKRTSDFRESFGEVEAAGELTRTELEKAMATFRLED